MSDTSQKKENTKAKNSKPARRTHRSTSEKPKAAQGNWNRTFASQQPDSDDESETCIICTEKIEYGTLTECNHLICHKCGFRQRALFDKYSCIVCRTELTKNIIITEAIDKKFEDFKPGEFAATSDRYKIDFGSSFAEDATLKLLENQCPVCKELFVTFNQLSQHTKSEHNKFYCYLCANFKKAFVCELELYNYAQLKRHQKSGGSQGFSGHPRCQFCETEMFYSQDELNLHLREKHERCHVCDQIDISKPKYFKNYKALYQHFCDDHYVCTVSSCLEKKFIAFADELSLRAHMIADHPQLVGGSKTLQSISSSGYGGARRYRSELTTFDQSSEHQDTYDTKKLRFEERARHYLGFSPEKYREFTAINKQFFNPNGPSAQELIFEYQELFKQTSARDLALLIEELIDLTPKNVLEKQRQLKALASEQFKVTEQSEKFPVLGAGTASSSKPLWTTAPTKKERNLEAFPVLGGGSNSSSSSSVNTWGSKKGGFSSSSEGFPLMSSSNKAPVNSSRYRTLGKKKVASDSGINAESFSKMQLNDAPNWTTNQKTGSSTSLSSSSNDEFPALPTQAARAVRLNKSVKYTTVVTKSNGKSKIQTSSSGNGSGMRITIAKPKNPNSTLLVTNHAQEETPVEWGPKKEPASELQASESKPGKKKKQKQILFHMGI